MTSTGPVPPPGPPSTATWGVGPAGPPLPAANHPAGAPPAGRTRLADGVLVGVAAAAVAGVLWWASVAFTERQFVYGAIIVGLIVGQGVLLGARRGGVAPALVAGIATLAALVVAEYFIQRSLAVSQADVDVPLWMGFQTAKTVVREGVKEEPATGLFWLLAVGAAVLTTASKDRRPVR